MNILIGHIASRLRTLTLLLSVVLMVPANLALASPSAEVYRQAKSGTVLIIGINDTDHSISLGSGFFISEDGVLVTNAHIVEDSTRVMIYVGDQTIFQNPDVLFVDGEADLAALRIHAGHVDALSLARELPEESTPVITVGYPRLTDILNMGFALHSTIAPGSISGVAEGRTRTQGRQTTFLQMTGTLNSGNSGGPIIDMDSGEAVGMMAQTVPYLERARDRNGNVLASVMIRSGIGYAIPATRIRQWLVENQLASLTQLDRPSSVLSNNAKKDNSTFAANRSFATGHLLHTMAIMLSMDSDLLELAVSHYEVALAQRPGASWIEGNLGMAYFSLGKKDKAVAKFAEAFRDDPRSATAAHYLGLVLEANGPQKEDLNTWEVFLTKLAPSADQDEWNTHMREAVTRAEALTASLPSKDVLASPPTSKP
jgi:S1-C subfamily serine protease